MKKLLGIILLVSTCLVLNAKDCNTCNGTGFIKCGNCGGGFKSETNVKKKKEVDRKRKLGDNKWYGGLKKLSFGSSSKDCKNCGGQKKVKCPDCNPTETKPKR